MERPTFGTAEEPTLSKESPPNAGCLPASAPSWSEVMPNTPGAEPRWDAVSGPAILDSAPASQNDGELSAPPSMEWPDEDWSNLVSKILPMT